ncbi:MAG: UDP-4-amino-4,6-dideoxy-N-acetyl-beta-L-altrosamine transaminase [Bdellovibrionota bacterium]|nr:UDP-4-amino-4,6-dideoxy-N-acetyl-beta-L-altrosamine transaminase [Bdellovibrionota bacterium]
MIPYGRQNISEEDIQEVVKVLKSDFITQGPLIPEFENKLSQYVGAKHAVAVNSATSALHIACLALGLTKGDTLWTSPNSFVASSNCGLYCGADVDFVDIDEATFNMCPKKLEEKLINAKQEKKLPKVVIPVHFSGASCEMKRIHELSKEYGFFIIEDASHAVGADYEKTKVGSCSYSDIAVFSFHPVKIITTAEGGVAFTNNDELAKKMGMLRTHGITKDSEMYTADFSGPWKYEQQSLGLNYRLTDIQACLGLSQLKRLDEFVLKRRELAKKYTQELKDVKGLSLPSEEFLETSSWHLYVIRVDEGSRRESLFKELRHHGIGVNVHYIPIHLQPYYQQLGFKAGDFPVSEDYYNRCISIPLFPDLTDSDFSFVVEKIKELLN